MSGGLLSPLKIMSDLKGPTTNFTSPGAGEWDLLAYFMPLPSLG
jgi:hypothetical protein